MVSAIVHLSTSNNNTHPGTALRMYGVLWSLLIGLYRVRQETREIERERERDEWDIEIDLWISDEMVL